METATHKPVKVRTGVYTYRGVTIEKSPRRGFCVTVFSPTGYYRIGLSTLAVCVADVDKYLANGATIVGTKLSIAK